jgi:AbrB family looped-hinge helix DNA binding protein
MEVIDEVRVGPEGRVLIPVAARRALGIEPGSTMVLGVEGDHLVLVPRETLKRRLRDMFRDVPGSMADELIMERKRDAERDFGGG